MKLRIAALLLIVATIAGPAAAHGDKKHIMGTLEKINANSIIVKQRDGKSVEVKLTADTTYLEHSGKENKPARFSDLSVGDLVAIHASPKGESFEADEIKFSAPMTATAPKQ